MRKQFGIYKKLLLILLFTVILPLIACSIWLFSFQNDFINNFMLLSARHEITQMADRINFELSQLQNVGNQIHLNQGLLHLLEADLPYTEKANSIRKHIHGFGAMTSNLTFRMLFLDRAGNTYGNALRLKAFPHLDEKNCSWNNLFKDRFTEEVWITDSMLDTIFADRSLPNIYLIRKLHNAVSHEEIGTVIISLSEKEIRKKYMGYLENYQNAYILKEDGSIISSVINTDETILPGDISKFSDVYLSRGNNPKQMISYHTIRLNQWKFLITSDYAVMIQPFVSLVVRFLLILLISFLLIGIALYLLIRHLMAPVKRLHKSMTLVRDGDLSVRVKTTSNDEIGELSNQFNSMIDRINKLMNDKLLEQNEKRKAELKAFQAQIHPHFLYNALASVRGLMMTGDLVQADQALLSLVHILKSMLSSVEEKTTLRQELSIIKEYIKLQQLSFSSPFEVTINLQEGLENACMLKLLLQPLVENAILHGLKPSRKPEKQLSLTAWKEDSTLHIQVNDNGVGFHKESFQPYPTSENDLTHSGVGLQNVRDRILFSYGEDYGLEITSAPESGTSVNLTLPLLYDEVPYVAYR